MPSLNIHLNASADDAYVFGGVTTSTSLVAIGQAATGNYIARLRFSNVTIPAGSQINSATLVLVADQTDAASCQVKIYAEAVDSAPSTTNATAISTAALTSTFQAWTPAAWTANDTDIVSADFTSVVQEVIDRDNWSSGNALAFQLRNAYATPGTFQRRRIRGYDQDSGAAAFFRVSWTAPATITSAVTASEDDEYVSGSPGSTTFSGAGTVVAMGQNTAGSYTGRVRFSSVAVPANSVIITASIAFVAAVTESSTATIEISIETVDNAAQTTTAATILAAALSANRTTWSPGAWTVGTTYNTASVKLALQEVVGRPGWVNGNAVAFQFRNLFPTPGTIHRRQARTWDYDGADRTQVAVLSLTYADLTTFLATEDIELVIVDGYLAQVYSPPVGELGNQALILAVTDGTSAYTAQHLGEVWGEFHLLPDVTSTIAN